MLRCQTLHALSFGGWQLCFTQEQLQRVCTELPLLQSLGLSWVSLESVDPLCDAAQLRELYLSGCFDNVPPPATALLGKVQWRTLLECLTLYDTPEAVLTPKESEPLNRALLARLPRLSLAHFEQNSLRTNNRRHITKGRLA